MDLLAQANALEAAGHDIVHLEAGQPGSPAPERVRHAAQRVLESGSIGYTEGLGMPALRARIARHYGERYDLDVAPARIVITTGSSAGFILAFLARFDDRARVAVTAPYYPAYPNILTALGYEPVIVPTDRDTAFQPTAALLQAAQVDLQGLMVASPANPTGAMIEPGELAQIAAYCDDRGIGLISDEIYHGITYGKTEQTALRLGNDVMVLNSFSKYYCMTGWRIGWLVAPEPYLPAIERLAQNLYISPPTIGQVAALESFACLDELDDKVAIYRQNRDYLLRELPRIGFGPIAPADGAFYLYVDVAHLTDNTEAFCRAMLTDIGVAATPGVDFDVGRRALHVRFSYAGTPDRMREAVKRMGPWLADRTRQTAAGG